MAIEIGLARLLLTFTSAGESLGRVITLGRQNYLLRPKESRILFAEFGRALSPEMLVWPEVGYAFADTFLNVLGAGQVDSMDIASYEGASILHDLNLPITDPKLVETFDTLIDGGTLEHVFNFPQGLVNAMRMVKCGGWYIANSPANNWMGHGFYQISPETFFRALSPENGFGDCYVILSPESMSLKWYLIRDPQELKARTNLINNVRTNVMVLARKERPTPEQITLRQSDYEPFWARNEARLNDGKRCEDKAGFTKCKNLLFNICPGLTLRLRTLDARAWSREYRLGRKDVYAPITPEDLRSILINRRLKQNRP